MSRAEGFSGSIESAKGPKYLRQKSATYCQLAWSHTFIGPGGQVKPCCRYRSSERSESMNLNVQRDLSKILNADSYVDLRERMLRGESSPGCVRCYEEEASGKNKSLRQIYNDDEFIHGNLSPGTRELRYLELSSSNLCNCACRMCEPRYSVRWANDWQALYGSAGKYAELQKVDVDSILPQLTDIRHLKFTGGEPFLIEEYLQILEEIVRLGNSKDVYLNYSTNLTTLPSDRLKELWSQFKHVEIAFSLDGIGKVNEYVRYPSKWPTIERVAKEILSLSNEINLRCGLRSTVMIYNVLDLPNVFRWWKLMVDEYYREPFSDNSWFNPTHVTHPNFLSLRVLPGDIKELVREQLLGHKISPRVEGVLQHFCRYMDSKDDSHLLEKFKKYTNHLDDRRGQSFKDLYPELQSLVT